MADVEEHGDKSLLLIPLLICRPVHPPSVHPSTHLSGLPENVLEGVQPSPGHLCRPCRGTDLGALEEFKQTVQTCIVP